MRTLPLVAALLVGVITQAPLAAQDKPTKPNITDAQKKEAEEKLQELLKQLRALEEQKAGDAKKAAEKAAEEAKKAAEALRKAAEQPKPGQPAFPMRGGGFMPWQQFVPNDPRAALEGLLKSSDPKVAALAKELLNALPKQPAPATPFKVEIKPGEKPDVFEYKLERFTIPGDGKPRVLVVPDPAKPAVPMTPATPAAPVGGSTLKLSADGKTAAVVAADGTITIYDVATGKEQMKFPGKK